jgi:hypothetical protein
MPLGSFALKDLITLAAVPDPNMHPKFLPSSQIHPVHAELTQHGQ